MTRRRLLLLGFVLLVTLLVVFFTLPDRPEPQWQGKPLGYWFEHRIVSGRSIYTGDQAFVELGTNAVPFLLDRLALKGWKPQPKWRNWLWRQKWVPPKVKLALTPPQMDLIEVQNRSLQLLERLGPKATSAQSALLDLLNRTSPHGDSVFKIGLRSGQISFRLTTTNTAPFLTGSGGEMFLWQLSRTLIATKPNDPETVRRLIEVLEHDSRNVSSSIEQALTSDVMYPLIESSVLALRWGIEHTNANVSSGSRFALGHFLGRHFQSGSPDTGVTPALNFLRQHDLSVKQLVAGWLGDLAGIHRWPVPQRTSGLRVLGVESPGVLDQITARVLQADGTTLTNGLQLLGAIGSAAKRSLPALEQVFARTGVEGQALTADVMASIKQTTEARRFALCMKLMLPSEGVVASAAAQLGQMGADATPAIPALAEALAHPNERARAWVAKALGKLGQPSRPALAQLRAALEDEYSFVRDAAREAIDRIEAESP